MGIYYKKKKNEQLNQLHLSSQSSINITKKNLEKAAAFKVENNKPAFFEEISRATTGYIQKKYSIPNVELNLNAVKGHLSKNDVEEGLIETYTIIQQRCEMARFAGQYGDMEGLYEKASFFITSLDQLS
jgi:hypothetical protein